MSTFATIGEETYFFFFITDDTDWLWPSCATPLEKKSHLQSGLFPLDLIFDWTNQHREGKVVNNDVNFLGCFRTVVCL